MRAEAIPLCRTLRHDPSVPSSRSGCRAPLLGLQSGPRRETFHNHASSSRRRVRDHGAVFCRCARIPDTSERKHLLVRCQEIPARSRCSIEWNDGSSALDVEKPS